MSDQPSVASSTTVTKRKVRRAEKEIRKQRKKFSTILKYSTVRRMYRGHMPGRSVSFSRGAVHMLAADMQQFAVDLLRDTKWVADRVHPKKPTVNLRDLQVAARALGVEIKDKDVMKKEE